jgi:murein DD-endopeptidase MepM/ murein hydrolase activator NlpD
MHKRKLLIGLATAGLFLAGFGAATMPASAEQRTLLVTLLGGSQITVTVDVAPGTPVDQIHIPGVTTPIVAVQDITPAQPQPQQQQNQPPVQVQVNPSTDQKPSQPSSGSGDSGSKDSGSGSSSSDSKDSGSSGSSGNAPSGSGDAPTQAPTAGQQVQQEVTGKLGKAQAPVEAAKKKAKDTVDQAKDTAGLREPNGEPTPANPTLSEAFPGPAPIGVPNFFIDKFRIPPFLLPIYQAAGIEYGVRWEILAAINEIETDYGRNLNISTAGAVGWMQFMPSTWKRYGVDANHDGKKDPYNPVDAIFAAARYLKAARADQDVRGAVFAYNHADWYVDSVLMRARLIGGLPADLVGSLTGLTQGHFPVYAKARYADDISERDAKKRIKHGNAALPVNASSTRRGINIFAKAGSPVIAVQDGKIVHMGKTKRLGKFIMLRDVYGNTYTYAHLKKLSVAYPVPKDKTVSKAQVNKELHLATPKRDPKPTAPASAGKQVETKAPAAAPAASPVAGAAQAATNVTQAAAGAAQSTAGAAPEVAKERVFANPSRPAAYSAGGEEQLLNAGSVIPGYTTFKSYFTGIYGLKRSDVVLKKLKPGSKVIAGTILGRIGSTEQKMAPHMLFEIRPAGRGAPRIDPKPILDGWKLLESTAIYRAAGKNPFWGPDSKNPSIGQILLMSKEALQHRVLTDPGIEIYDCGRRDIKAGGIDRRVLATLEFLSASGLKPTVTALHCGHSYLTTSGNVSEHSSGNAVDIAKINGIPILGHQGPGSITDITIRRLLTLQGAMKPHQIISLMTFDGADNTLALPDHNDHIHVGFQPLFGTNDKLGRQLDSALKPGQWIRLMKRLGNIDNPTVPIKPSKYAIKVPKRASKAHVGE